MKLTRVTSKKSGRVGYRGRYTDPISGKRRKHTEWFADRRLAEEAWRLLLDGLEARKKGLPDNSGWEMPYSKLVERFLADAPISSDVRRVRLKGYLEKNLACMAIGADFTAKGRLTGAARKIAHEHGESYVIRCIQEPLKQVAAWAASIGLFPYDPLHSWKRLPRTKARVRRRAYGPNEVRAILTAADDLDGLLNRPFPTSTIIKTLLVTGSRPGAIYGAKVKDLRADRIHLGPGNGKKHNGRCTIPPPFAAELARYVAFRKAGPNDPLLVSPMGAPADRYRMLDLFRRAAILAFTRMNWPTNHSEAASTSPIDVALAIDSGKISFDGVRPTNPTKVAVREAKRNATEIIVNILRPHVAAALENRPLYVLRHTHITWARAARVNPDNVKSQVGHKGGDTQEQNYNDPHLLDAGASSLAVWEILTEARELKGADRLQVLPLAAGAEQMAPVVAPDNEKPPLVAATGSSQVVSGKGDGRYRNRTCDLVGVIQLRFSRTFITR